MGEGAALLVLEDAEVAPSAAAPTPYAELMGYGATSDAYHMVQPRADGREAARAATIALDGRRASQADEIDYVNAHASSTPIGDIAEARAIALALGERAATVPVSGTKALYGHPLGASGAIEAAICALAIRDGWAPASVNLVDPDPEIAALLPGLLRDGRDGTLPAGAVDLVRVRRAQRGAGARRGRRLTAGASSARAGRRRQRIERHPDRCAAEIGGRCGRVERRPPAARPRRERTEADHRREGTAQADRDRRSRTPRRWHPSQAADRDGRAEHGRVDAHDPAAEVVRDGQLDRGVGGRCHQDRRRTRPRPSGRATTGKTRDTARTTDATPRMTAPLASRPGRGRPPNTRRRAASSEPTPEAAIRKP